MGVRIRNKGLRGEPWKECAVCGMEFPSSHLWFRRGRFVCRENCEDADLLKESATPDMGEAKQVNPT